MHLAGGAAALPAIWRIARAQAYPTRPVRIIVGFAAGGPADTMARLIGQWLSERLGQQFIVENRPGAASNVATEAVVNAPPDGYTFLVATSVNAINATLYDKLNFNLIRDVVPVASIHREAHVMVVSPAVPVKTVPEFITHAMANPGKINMASAGSGSTSHVSVELFKMVTGLNLVHVPYRGVGPALVDLLGGQVQGMFATMSSSIEYVRGGKLRALAVTTATRSPVLPDIPTVQSFLPGYEVSTWYGIGAPKATPVDIIEKLNKETNAALADPKIKERIENGGGVVIPGSPADFGRLIADETDKWAKVIRAANIKPD